MKKIVVMLLLGFFAVAGNAQAEYGDGAYDRHDKMADKKEAMFPGLDLTPEQKEQVQAFMKEMKAKKAQLWDEKKAGMEALHTEFKTKLKTILSEEQFKKWEAAKENWGEMRGAMKDGCPLCKDGKKCAMCEKKMKAACPHCKDGKKCDMGKDKMKSGEEKKSRKEKKEQKMKL